MKKWLAVLLSVLMLFSTCALADGMDVTLSNVQVAANGQMVIDLSGMDFGLSFASDGSGVGLRLKIANGGQTMDDAVLAVLEDGLLLESSALSDSYTMALEALLGTVDVNALAENATSSISPEDGAVLEDLGAVFAGILDTSIADADAATIDGVEYSVKSVEISQEQMDEVIDCLLRIMDNHPELLRQLGVSSASELKEALDPRLSVSGNVYDSENSGLLDVTVTLGISALPEPATLRLYIEGAGDVAEGGVTLHTEFTGAMGVNEGILALDIALANDRCAWLPTAVPEDAVDVMELMADQEAAQATLQKLQTEATALVMRVMSSVMTVAAQNAQ